MKNKFILYKKTNEIIVNILEIKLIKILFLLILFKGIAFFIITLFYENPKTCIKCRDWNRN